MSLEYPRLSEEILSGISLPFIPEGPELSQVVDQVFPSRKMVLAGERVKDSSNKYTPKYDWSNGHLVRNPEPETPYCFECEGDLLLPEPFSWRSVLKDPKKMASNTASDLVRVVELEVFLKYRGFAEYQFRTRDRGVNLARFKFSHSEDAGYTQPTGIALIEGGAYIISPPVVGWTRYQDQVHLIYDRRRYQDLSKGMSVSDLAPVFCWQIRKSNLTDEEVKQVFPDQATDEAVSKTAEL